MSVENRDGVASAVESLAALQHRFERELRRSRLLLGINLMLTVGVIASVIADRHVSGGLRRDAIRVEDDGPTGFLGADDRGAALILNDSKGDQRAILGQGVGAGGAILALGNSKVRDRIVLSESADGPSLRMMDSAGRLRIEIDVMNDEPHLVIVDADGKVQWSALPIGK